MHRIPLAVLTTWLLLLCAPPLRAATDQSTIAEFQSAAGLARWEFSAPVHPGAAHDGAASCRLEGGHDLIMSSGALPADWSAGDALEMRFFVEGPAPVAVTLWIGDAQWEAKRSYWNRHNRGFILKPGANTISLPVAGLWRGEAGSRNNDLKSDIDPANIRRMTLGFASSGGATLFLIRFRLVTLAPPAGIVALDFGPEHQAVEPGFTAISPSTVHGQDGHRAGWTREGIASRGRDDTFPTPLLEDYIEPALDDMELVVDLPDGPAHVWFIYSDCGYWGGEQAKATRRSIDADGREAYADVRGDGGRSDYLFRFEPLEPRIGDSLWTEYLLPLFTPRSFPVSVHAGALHLRFHSDAPWSSKLAAMILYPDAKRSQAEAWIAEVMARTRQEFEVRAVLEQPGVAPADPPPAALRQGWWLGHPGLEDALTPEQPPGPDAGALAATAARGQRATFTFAIRPLQDLGPLTVQAGDLVGSSGQIPASAIQLGYLHQGLQRGSTDLSYSIQPDAVRPLAGSGPALERMRTRQLWITVCVPEAARPGTYAGTLAITAGPLHQQLPITLEVLDLSLDALDLPVGCFGLDVPDGLAPARQATALRDLLTLLHDYGMTSFSGGPDIAFTGLDAAGRPLLDFAACDAFFKTVALCGFHQEIFSYGGPAMVSGLHDGYRIGDTGHAWERRTGKSFGELLSLVWDAVGQHAREAHWPVIDYGMTDEPRTLEDALAQLELHQAYRKHAPAVRIGGFYSVDWGESEFDHTIQAIFKTLTWSALNSCRQADIDQARSLGRELYLYNQGSQRFLFGQFLWARMHQGVRGLMQWHTSAISGYQFFDLDGREPDTAMVQWGQHAIYPTIALVRCAEGITDLRYALTLSRLASRHPDLPEAREALGYLADMVAAVPPDRHDGPQDGRFRAGCIQRLRTLLRTH